MNQEQNYNIIIRNVIIIVIVILILLTTITFRVSPALKKMGYRIKIWFKKLLGKPFLY